MIKTSDGDSFEKNRSIQQELTFNALFEEFKSRNLEFEQVQMENIGIMTSDKIYTNLGLLVSDQCKHTIKLAVFQGKDKEVFKDRKEFGGSLFSQLKDAYGIINLYNATKAGFHGLLRTDIRDYPEAALREALLNSIVHREYSFSGNTLINLYSDRIEFISLGGLVPGLSLKAAMMGASQPRNEKLAALFYRLKLIEAYGTGISKIISSYKDFDLKPVFESVEGAFRVILPNVNTSSATIKIVDHEKQYDKYLPILNLLTLQKEFVRKDVEKVMGVGSTHALNIIKEMLDKKLIKKIGDGKNTKYIKV